jgi:hypothetical protein
LAGEEMKIFRTIMQLLERHDASTVPPHIVPPHIHPDHPIHPDHSNDGGELELKKLFDLVEGNARLINETYASVHTLRKAVAIVQTLLEEHLENPAEQLLEVARQHAEWDGESPHPYGCDEDDDAL